MAKDLITIGLQLANQEYHSLSERISLQDYDIVVFYPSMPSYGYDTDSQGSQSLTYTDSSRYHEDVSHWRTELSNAFVDSKTVFIFLPAMRTFDVKTGAPQTKGRVTTHHVSTRDNYSYLPMRIDGMKNASGNKINFLGNPAFADFWSDYKSELTYENYFENDYGSSVFTTKGGRSVGTLKLLDNGYLVALPLLNFEKDHFTKYKAGEEYWTDEATQFSKRFIQHIVQIDRAIRAEDQATPMPEWVSKTADSQKSKAIEQALVTNSAEIEALITVKEQLRGALIESTRIKGLLYEKGKPLERAIIDVLRAMGYQAEGYDDGNLEFDQVIIDPEGNRYIGEAEGKDSHAINIDKFRQLNTNLDEDFERDEVHERANGILFGNGFRLSPPSDRDTQFTEKCIKNAKRTITALVQTSDLYKVAVYLADKPDDEDYKKLCRDSITLSKGEIVHFPDPPLDRTIAKSEGQ